MYITDNPSQLTHNRQSARADERRPLASFCSCAELVGMEHRHMPPVRRERLCRWLGFSQLPPLIRKPPRFRSVFETAWPPGPTGCVLSHMAWVLTFWGNAT